MTRNKTGYRREVVSDVRYFRHQVIEHQVQRQCHSTLSNAPAQKAMPGAWFVCGECGDVVSEQVHKGKGKEPGTILDTSSSVTTTPPPPPSVPPLGPRTAAIELIN